MSSSRPNEDTDSYEYGFLCCTNVPNGIYMVMIEAPY